MPVSSPSQNLTPVAPRAVPGTIGPNAGPTTHPPGTLAPPLSPVDRRDRAGTVATGFNAPGTLTKSYGLRDSGTVC